MELNFMAGGEAGQGVQTIGLVMARTLARGGLHIFADQDYESRIRGGHNFFRIRVRDTEVRALSERIDLLVALNKETIDLHRNELKKGGIAVFDREKTNAEVQGDNFFDVPLEKLAMETTQDKLMTNAVAMGAAVALFGYSVDILTGVLKEHFARPGSNVGELNGKAATAGYQYAKKHHKTGTEAKISPSDGHKRMVLTGNDAAALGAIAAGCKFAAGYPMTPASAIIEFLAEKGTKYNVVTMQPEDEISAINMVVGAAYAGVRSMTATSGGGFCLMVEALSLAGIIEGPVVIVLGMRPGPAIGLPTRTEQGELLFSIFAGHGEFPRAVLAPSTAGECFHAMVKAFNLAEKYQTPVIVLMDHHLATSYNTVEKYDLGQVQIDRGMLLTGKQADDAGYKRYRFSDTGVSPRGFPGQGKALMVADSDEHNEEGHIIEDGETRRRMVEKRMRKLEGIKSEISGLQVHREPKAELTLVGWGSTFGAIEEAVATLRKDGMKANHVHLSEVWPFPSQAFASAVEGVPRCIVVENNATGQMARLIRGETGIKASGSILKFDGRPFSPQEIIEAVKKVAVYA